MIATVARRHPLLELDPDTPSWDGAACRDHDPELFFHDDYTGTAAQADTAEAKAICRRCPIRQQCLAWAIQHKEPWGVFGGLTAAERNTVGVRYCENCHINPIDLDSRAKYCATCRPIVRARRGDNRRRT